MGTLNRLSVVFGLCLSLLPAASIAERPILKDSLQNSPYFSLRENTDVKVGTILCRMTPQGAKAGRVTRVLKRGAFRWLSLRREIAIEIRNGASARRLARLARIADRLDERCEALAEDDGESPTLTPTAEPTPPRDPEAPGGQPTPESTPTPGSTPPPANTPSPTPTASAHPTPGMFVATDQGDEQQVRLSWTDPSSQETGFVIQRETWTGSEWGNGVQYQVAANTEESVDTPGVGSFRYRVGALYAGVGSRFTAWLEEAVVTGWTQFTPSSDTRIVYVSSSEGSDSNNGLSESTPKRTLAAGYTLLRDGYPDWILLKRGDTWTHEGFTPNWDKNGRSATERILIGTYGSLSLPRPLIIADASGELIYHNPANNPLFSNIAVVGIHARGQGTETGIYIAGPGSNFLIEDCMLERFVNGITIQSTAAGVYYDNAVIRRNVIVDSYIRGGHSQGMYALRVRGLTVEENVFDHNGYNEEYADAVPTIFNHNMYLSVLCTDVVVRRNISTRAASHGAQMRSGGTCEDNLFARNSLGFFVAQGESVARHNVVLEGKDISPTLRRGFGIDTLQISSALISYNIVAHKLTDTTAAAFTAGYEANFAGQPHNALFEHNISYRWNGPGFSVSHGANSSYTNVIARNNFFQLDSGSIVNHVPGPFDPSRFSYSGNQYFGVSPEWRVGTSSGLSISQWRSAVGETDALFSAPQFPDPERTIATYHQALGRPATFDAFISEARQQRKGYWRPEYTASAVNNYIRAGFGMPDP